MLDMPSVSDDNLELIMSEIANIKRGRKGDHYRPHKLVMLLSVIELVTRGLLTENRIYLHEPLLSIYEGIFLLVQSKDDLCQPGPPFFHLRTSGFWFHKVKRGQEDTYVKLTTTGGGLQIIDENIEYAYLREDVYKAFCSLKSRQILRQFISSFLNPRR